MNDELLIEAFITSEIKHAVGRGHDRGASYSDKQNGCNESLMFINSDQFDIYCGFLGYDAQVFRQRIHAEAPQKLPQKSQPLVYQIVFMECV